jgi:hypothetical protein
LVEAGRAEAGGDAPFEQGALRIAELVRTHTGRRWVGVYRIDGGEVVNLANPGDGGERPVAFCRGGRGAANERASELLHDGA